MSKPTIIYCPCGDPCGKLYPDTRWEQGGADGPGEDYQDDEGNWYCSEDCLDRAIKAGKAKPIPE